MRPPTIGSSTRRAVVTILPVFLLAGALSLDSGIRGHVVLGPLTPSSRIGQSAREKPFRTSLDIVRADDESLVTQIQTRPNGSFVVALPPGDYIVRSASPDEKPRPSIDPVAVTVPPHAYVAVTIHADTGIR